MREKSVCKFIMGKSEKRQGKGEGKKREENICRERERKEGNYLDRKWERAIKYRDREKEKERERYVERGKESEEKCLCRYIMGKGEKRQGNGEGKRERGKDM